MSRRKGPLAKGDHTVEECNHRVEGVPIHHHPQSAKDGKPVIQIRTGTESKDIIIPSREPLAIPGILARTDFDRLKKQAKVLTQEEKNALYKEAERKKRQQQVDAENRKELLRKAQSKRAEKSSILQEAEEEAAKKSEYMLQRAHELQEEQSDEMKTLNRVILASKCLAIREAQIMEKAVIKRELEEENRRLDVLMEQNRQRAIAEEKAKQRDAEERNRTFVAQVKEQLKAHEIQALIKRERNAEEARNSNKLVIALQEATLEEKRLKHAKQEQTRADLIKSIEDAAHHKALQAEEERILEMRLKAFRDAKEKEEDERRAQAAMMKGCKDSDIQRLGEKVREQRELAAKREEMNLLRMQEECEREWRQKEMQKAEMRRESLERLREERKKQIEDIRREQAMEITRDQQQVMHVSKVQREFYELEMGKRKEERERAERNRRELLLQVNSKEKERIERRRRVMEEGEALRLEKQLEKTRLLETLDRKLDSLKDCSLPAKVVQDVRRQADRKIKAHII